MHFSTQCAALVADAALALAVRASTTAAGSDAPGERVLCAGFGDREAWAVSADEPWWALVDMRDMLTLFHPLVVPETGNAAGASRELTIPDEWEPPFALRFYCSDNYSADPEKHRPGQLGTEAFFEHRYKQALIDDVVVWERDVADDSAFGSQTVFSVDVTPYVTPGKPFRLTLRALDKSSTLERNSRDVWFIAGGTWYSPKGDAKTEEPPRFHTEVWFADAMVGETQAVAAAPPGQRPHVAAVAARHHARWPVAPRGEQVSFPVALELLAPATVPASGFPITCGIPMPPGALREAAAVRLTDATGRDLPVQTQVTGTWLDGSVRWLLLNSIAPGGAAPGDRLALHLNEGQAPPPQTPVKVRRSGSAVTISTGAVRVRLSADSGVLVDAVYIANKRSPVMTRLAPRMSVLYEGTPTPVTATVQKLEIVERGPVAARVELHGSLDTEQQHIGRFSFRLYAYAGLPTIQTHFRIIDDVRPEPSTGTPADKALEVTDLALVAAIAGARGTKAVGVAGGDPLASAADTFSLLQDTQDHFICVADGATAAEGGQAQGWIAAAGENGSVQASMWRFWEQYPKSLTADGVGLEIGLFAPSSEMPVYTPRFGEAKRHGIWLTFSEVAAEASSQVALGLLADAPPRLMDRRLFCQSGAMAVLDPQFFSGPSAATPWAQRCYDDASVRRAFSKFGIRNFGDLPYDNDGRWRNGRWAMVQGPLSWGLSGGSLEWLERSHDVARHIVDVDCAHIPEGSLDWEKWHGCTTSHGHDHSVRGEWADGSWASWAAFQIGESLILDYWMTGDPDSREAGLANADYIRRHMPGLGSEGVRDQARPMLTLLRAWQMTGKRKYLTSARRYFSLKFMTDHLLDWRRGAYISRIYQNWHVICPTLDSMYAQNVYDYYRLTGDPDAAQLIVAIADSVYSESMLPQEEALGSIIYYVRYSRNAYYYQQMAMLFHMAYDLTGDERFLRAGRAVFARYLLPDADGSHLVVSSWEDFGWLDPEYGGWAREHRQIETAPFTITSQTPDPDPASFRPQ
jgi:hypothetical protein